MDSSVVSALEKIKQQEQSKDALFKEKREFEAAKVFLERSIQEAKAQSNKYDQDIAELLKDNDDLKAQLTIHEIRRDMLVAQLTHSTRELEDLRVQEVQAASELNELRSNYCKAVQEVSDECDVWALLKRPAPQSAPYKPVKKPVDNVGTATLVNEARLKAALERKDQVLAERKRLQAEPDEGEEFVRIKNALRYSMEMTANLRNKTTDKDNGHFEPEL